MMKMQRKRCKLVHKEKKKKTEERENLYKLNWITMERRRGSGAGKITTLEK